MKFWSRLMLILFVSLGFVIGFVTIYRISVVGTYGKMGLNAYDYSQYVSNDRLKDLVIEVSADDISCGFREYFTGWIRYRMSSGAERGVRSFVLGERRVICGVRQVLNGSEKWGAYTLMKGISYLEAGGRDFGAQLCEHPDTVAVSKSIARSSWYIGAFLDSSDGSLHDSVAKPYSNLVSSWRQYPCLDE